MAPKDVSKLYPNAAELGRKLGVTGACVNMWRVRGAVPIMAQLRLNVLSKGRLRPDAKTRTMMKKMNLDHLIVAAPK